MAKRLIAAVFAAFLMGSAQAIVYDEASGDLAPDSALLLELESGENNVENKVLGSGLFSNDVVDFDGFRFSLMSGQRLKSIVFAAWDLENPTAVPELSMVWLLKSGDYSGSLVSDQGVADVRIETDQNLFEDVLPRLGPGTYAFDPEDFTSQGAISTTWRYEIIFDVENNQVPEPESLLLLGLGLVGLAFSRRKKKLA